MTASAAIYATAQDGDIEIPHLCNEGEEVVFSCMTGDKNISFCATPRYTASTGSMVYRFGVAGQALEMEYPSRPTSVGKAFRVSALVVEPRLLYGGVVGTPKKEGSIYWRHQAAIEFQKSHEISMPEGVYTEVAFQKGVYIYTFFHQITDWIYRGQYNGAGLVVERAGREPFYLMCNDAEQAVGGKGGDSRFFPRRLGYLNAQLHLKDDFKYESKWFRGVSPLNKDRSIELYPLRVE
jgi:hypothetical protein